jgi:hypothetical protein
LIHTTPRSSGAVQAVALRFPRRAEQYARVNHGKARFQRHIAILPVHCPSNKRGNSASYYPCLWRGPGVTEGSAGVDTLSTFLELLLLLLRLPALLSLAVGRSYSCSWPSATCSMRSGVSTLQNRDSVWRTICRRRMETWPVQKCQANGSTGWHAVKRGAESNFSARRTSRALPKNYVGISNAGKVDHVEERRPTDEHVHRGMHVCLGHAECHNALAFDVTSHQGCPSRLSHSVPVATVGSPLEW